MVDEYHLGWVMIFRLKEGINLSYFQGDGFEVGDWHPLRRMLRNMKMLSLTSLPHTVLTTTLTPVQAALLMFVNLDVIYPA